MSEIHEHEKFRAQGNQVIYHPPSYKNEDGSITHSLSPVICKTSDLLENSYDAAKQISEALNFYSEYKRTDERAAPKALESTAKCFMYDEETLKVLQK